MELIDYILELTDYNDNTSPISSLRAGALDLLKTVVLSKNYLIYHINLLTPSLINKLLRYLSQTSYDEDSVILGEIFINLYHKNSGAKQMITKAIYSYIYLHVMDEKSEPGFSFVLQLSSKLFLSKSNENELEYSNYSKCILCLLKVFLYNVLVPIFR